MTLRTTVHLIAFSCIQEINSFITLTLPMLKRYIHSKSGLGTFFPNFNLVIINLYLKSSFMIVRQLIKKKYPNNTNILIMKNDSHLTHVIINQRKCVHVQIMKTFGFQNDKKSCWKSTSTNKRDPTKFYKECSVSWFQTSRIFDRYYIELTI